MLETPQKIKMLGKKKPETIFNSGGQSAGNQIVFITQVGSSETTRETPFFFQKDEGIVHSYAKA